MKGLPKRKYAPEFRAEAVKLVESGVAQAEVALTCLGIFGPFITWKRPPRWLNRSAA